MCCYTTSHTTEGNQGPLSEKPYVQGANFCHFGVLSDMVQNTRRHLHHWQSSMLVRTSDSEVGENSYLACDNVSCVLTSNKQLNLNLLNKQLMHNRKKDDSQPFISFRAGIAAEESNNSNCQTEQIKSPCTQALLCPV